MKTRHVLLVIGSSFLGGYLSIAVFLSGGMRNPCKADCDPAGCGAPLGMACCNGDANGDRAIDLSDPIYLLYHLFAGGPAPVAVAESSCLTPEECSSLASMLPDLEFGRRIAGSWVTRFGNPPMIATATITADGCYNTCSEDMFNAGYYNAKYLSTGNGSWVRTGERQFVSVMLYFYYDEMGQPVFYMKARTVSNMNDEFTMRWGTIDLSTYHWYQDPLDPTEFPYETGTFSFDSRRISAE